MKDTKKEKHNKITKYSIDGIYGRTKFMQSEEQRDDTCTYNREVFDKNTLELIENEEFILGLPKDITKDDYFKMVLIDTIKNAIPMNSNLFGEKSSVLKGMEDQLQKLNKNIETLISLFKNK